MNKKQIIELLNEEIGLFEKHEDENSLRELYLTDIEFKEAKKVLDEVERLRKELRNQIEFYKKKILKNEKGNYILVGKDDQLKDKQFVFDGDLIIIPEDNVFVTNCVFINKSE